MTMGDLGLLALRLVTGGLLVGHGAQKLFGWFEGPGVHGFAKHVQGMGLRPAHGWASLAGISEFSGGLLTALGLLHPIGPITLLGPMGIAIGKVHWGKPIWSTSGGAELPLTNVAVATALMFAGPGRFSLDHWFGLRLPRFMVGLTAFATLGGLLYALTRRPAEQGQSGAQPEPRMLFPEHEEHVPPTEHPEVQELPQAA
jgi:putative oxidoreductase